MSDVMLNIVDSQRAIHGEVEGMFADAVIAALSAEPETISELQAALGRFIKPTARTGPFDNWRAESCDNHRGSGVCIVDLAARLVASRSMRCSPEPVGRVAYYNGAATTKARVPYHLSEDWLFAEADDGWRVVAEQRRRQRAASPPINTRKVLYGKVVEFLVSECLAAARSCGAEDPIAEIHARWLMTPRDDLRGDAPRDVLLAKREHIESDLQDRARQWSLFGECPPGLSRESAAFRFGGYGTHENILYFEMVRHLVETCWRRLVRRPDAEEATEVARLRRRQTSWLHTPQHENLQGYSPAQAIERERLRLPLAVSGDKAMVDDDCPLCQMMAEQSSPMFWHLDGWNTDVDFPFSFHRTRQEWELDHREWEDYNRRWEEARAEQLADKSPPSEAASPSQCDSGEPSSVWKRSYSNPQALGQLSGSQAREVMLFGIGGCLAELGLELKESPASAAFVKTFNRHFGNLREAARGPSRCLIQPVIQRFCDDLASAAETRPDLAEQCADLENQLNDLAQRLADDD
jgi:hypothetical protein